MPRLTVGASLVNVSHQGTGLYHFFLTGQMHTWMHEHNHGQTDHYRALAFCGALITVYSFEFAQS